MVEKNQKLLMAGATALLLAGYGIYKYMKSGSPAAGAAAANTQA